MILLDGYFWDSGGFMCICCDMIYLLSMDFVYSEIWVWLGNRFFKVWYRIYYCLINGWMRI